MTDLTLSPEALARLEAKTAAAEARRISMLGHGFPPDRCRFLVGLDEIRIADLQGALTTLSTQAARIKELEEERETLKDHVWLLENKVGDRSDGPTISAGMSGPILKLINAELRKFTAPKPMSVRERRLEAERQALTGGNTP